MSRRHFSTDAPEPSASDGLPRRVRYPCKANGCPMPGTIFFGSTDGVCGYHAGETPNTWPRITQSIHDWECVSRVINNLQRVLNAPDTCTDVKMQNEAMAEAWRELAESTAGSGWKQRVAPKEKELIGNWVQRLRIFLAARIKESIGGGVVDETKPTIAVADMLKGLRDVPLSAKQKLDPFA